MCRQWHSWSNKCAFGSTVHADDSCCTLRAGDVPPIACCLRQLELSIQHTPAKYCKAGGREGHGEYTSIVSLHPRVCRFIVKPSTQWPGEQPDLSWCPDLLDSFPCLTAESLRYTRTLRLSSLSSSSTASWKSSMIQKVNASCYANGYVTVLKSLNALPCCAV